MSFLSNDPEIRRAEQVWERPNWLVGKRTYIGLALTVLGMIGKRFDFVLPANEVNGFLDALAANWDALAEVFGSLLATYGAIAKAAREAKLKHQLGTTHAVLMRTKQELVKAREDAE